MKLPIYQVDAFTDQVFGGNPAAVVISKEELPDEVMLAIAAENNLSETAFLHPQESGYGLRWFTPVTEVDLCGHATLASAFVLFETGKASRQVEFITASGYLRVVKSGSRLSMDFPAMPPEPCPVPSRLGRALGGVPEEVLSARDLVAVFKTEEEVASLNPDYAELVQLDAFAVMATAPGREVDFVSRFFAPRAGILEDPVTGSAHCTLIPLWAERLGKRTLRARQISVRGGELLCEERGKRVIISGSAMMYLRGEIDVPLL